MPRQQGFSVVAIVLVLAVLATVAGTGYVVYSRTASKSGDTASQTTTVPASNSPTSSIDSITQNDASGESKIDSQYSNSDSTAAQSASPAASNVGGAYNESSL